MTAILRLQAGQRRREHLYGCGAYNAYVVKLNSASGHEWSTYLDGTGKTKHIVRWILTAAVTWRCSDRLYQHHQVLWQRTVPVDEWLEENGVDTTYVAVDASSNYYKTVHHIITLATRHNIMDTLRKQLFMVYSRCGKELL